jgi:hypothetical protein
MDQVERLPLAQPGTGLLPARPGALPFRPSRANGCRSPSHRPQLGQGLALPAIAGQQRQRPDLLLGAHLLQPQPRPLPGRLRRLFLQLQQKPLLADGRLDLRDPKAIGSEIARNLRQL